MESIKSDVLSKLTGSRGEKVIVAFNNDSDSKATIDDVSLTDAPAHYSYLSSECFSKLIVGHRVTSPLLLGIRESGNSLGNNAEEIKNATQLFDNLIIRVFQDQVIECIDAILSVNDIALDLYFKTLKPLDFTDIDVVNEEIIEEETGYELSLKKIDNIESYKTIKQAEAKALEQGCKGHHEHEIDGEIWYMPCESHEKASLSDKEEKNVLGSLAESGVKMSEDYVFVDEIDAEHEIDNEDWANALIDEKKSTLSKIKGFIRFAG